MEKIDRRGGRGTDSIIRTQLATFAKDGSFDVGRNVSPEVAGIMKTPLKRVRAAYRAHRDRALEYYKRVIELTPINTGQARANWHIRAGVKAGAGKFNKLFNPQNDEDEYTNSGAGYLRINFDRNMFWNSRKSPVPYQSEAVSMQNDPDMPGNLTLSDRYVVWNSAPYSADLENESGWSFQSGRMSEQAALSVELELAERLAKYWKSA